MSPLKLIIRREYLQDVGSRSFWIGTIALPVLMVAFGLVVGTLASDSESLRAIGSMGQTHDPDSMTGMQVLGMMLGMFLTIFLMVYGAMIFNKVKAEKTNRIMEIIATTVSGRTMMLAKVVAVALTGITQLLVWMLLIVAGLSALVVILDIPSLINMMLDWRIWLGLLYALLYFIGGYLLFGSFYAMVGAMTDRDNENQGYISILTFILLGSFYVSQYAVDNPGSPLTLWCAFIPLTSPGIGPVAALGGSLAWWQTLLSLAVLYASAWAGISVAGKVYTSTMLLTGSKFSFKDIVTFVKAR